MPQQETNTHTIPHRRITLGTYATRAGNNMADYLQEEQEAEVNTIQAQRGERVGQMIAKIQAPGHAVKDGRTFAFDLKWLDQTIGTEDPNNINGVLADYISMRVAEYYNYEDAGITDLEWEGMFRAVFRPRAGKVWTVNVREVFKPLFPACLPEHIFIKDANKKESKFKLSWKGETTNAPFNPSESDVTWMHFFFPATCHASLPEKKVATAGLLEQCGMELKKEEKDFHCIIPHQGKYQVNFGITSADIVAENLYKLAKFKVEGCGVKTYISPKFMAKLPENCTGCYTWLRFNKCFCDMKGQKKDSYKRAKDGEAAAQRKRRKEAASSSDAAF